MSKTTSPTNAVTPALAPPGAGLPALELFFARLLVGWKSKRTSRDDSAKLFATEHTTILQLIAGRNLSLLSQPVLIKRLPGLEDSSRYWSALMTLDHLRIVNREIAGVIASLCTGKIPLRTASTAAVKPSQFVDENVIANFTQSCRDLESVVATQTNLKTTAKYAHPWFGP
ncbi:MAG: hypothetical protein K8R87_13080, partial [Verrucomicrobia bacterium]|nr:hypothetical protein [Verrucomicrobiota bacterium]